MSDRSPSAIPTRRVTVKIGSAVIAPKGRLDLAAIDRLTAEIAAARDGGASIVVVSSGAVACGLGPMGLSEMPRRLDERQAAAAVGQPLLVSAWASSFQRFGVVAAQVLLTADDIEDRARFVNARRTIDTLLGAGVVPIVNENDSVAYEELRLGDNDRLSALTAGLAGADLLVILSTARGVCRDGPSGDVVLELDDIEEARSWVTRDRSDTGIGGMGTKLDAAAIARSLGVETVIAAGADPGMIARAIAGEAVGTRSRAAASAAAARKRWIGHKKRPRGAVDIDRGAADAIATRGASLLPKGILGATPADERGFAAGDLIDVRCEGVTLARGLTNYALDDVRRIAGRRSEEIAAILGYSVCDEVIHRDNLTVLNNPGMNA